MSDNYFSVNSNFFVRKNEAYGVSGVICSGYSSGSGNYFNAFFPCVSEGSITGCSFSNITLQVFFPDGTTRDHAYVDFTYSALSRTRFGIKIEFKFKSTQQINKQICVIFAGGTITFT